MSDAPQADPLLGKMLNGRFQILEPLGVGGMGRVYKAIQSPLDRMVALKVLNPRYAGSKDPGFERRFFLEAAMTAKLHHPNTITVHDYGRTDDGIFFIAMEFVEGETLQALLARETQVHWVRGLAIAGQVARSLREAHKLGLIHRDLKPANVMVLQDDTGPDRVKVLDFGLVKSFLPDGPLSPSETEITQAGVLLGSPLYMAPEQARNEADPRSDIYALGVLLFQCISGRPPFQGKESIDIIVKHIREKPPVLNTLVPEIPIECNALVMKCLEKEPANRFQSMDELLEAMRLATSTAGISGAFRDPRSLMLSSPSNPVVRIASPDAPEPTRAERAVDVPWDDSQANEAKQTKNKALVFAGAGVAALLVVVAIAVALSGGRKPTAADTEVPVKPLARPPSKPAPAVPEPAPPRVAPAPVTFVISSSPSGATVSLDGKTLGTTPLRHALPDGAHSASLSFELDGYQPFVIAAQGESGEVPVTARLLPVAKPAPKKPGVKKPGPKKDDDGYKDDPYQ